VPSGDSLPSTTTSTSPDLELLEDRLTLWHGAEACAVFESGMAAIATSLLSFVRSGDALTANRPLGSGYHDAKLAFILGHGQTARQNLESCVSCHTERDCLACHSAVCGRRFNPQGPDFAAERLARKNPEMYLACHRSVAMLP